MAAVLAAAKSPIIASVASRPPRRRARLLTLVAVVVGVLAGVWGCAAGMASGQAHHAGIGPAGIVASDDSDHSVSHDDATHDPDDGLASSPSGDVDASATPSHPGTACVVDVDLRFPDAVVDTVCDDLASANPFRPADHPSEPEPPVPRLS